MPFARPSLGDIRRRVADDLVNKLPGADTRRADGLAHVQMAFHPRVMDSILSEVGAMKVEAAV